MKIVAILFLLAVQALAVPQLINYQGQLTSPTGTLIDTTVSMAFRIYSASSGGTLV